MPSTRTIELAVRDPRRAARAVRFHVRNLWVKGRHTDPNSTTFARDARPGATASTFTAIKRVPGWFTYDDAAHFTLVLNTQLISGMQGDILEIGPYHGRSTIVLAECLRPGETLVVCDPFQQGEVYVADPPSPEALRQNIRRAVPHFDQSQLEVHEAYSTDLVLPPDSRFRFVHVDGSHEREDVIADLRLARRHLLPGGVIVIDDYDHPDWPGVTTAVRDFLSEAPELMTVADLNRHSESGRKLYLALPRQAEAR